MTDDELVTFLQWALPQLGLRWRGYRRVRRQVRKRITRRLAALGLEDLTAYSERLQQADPLAGEWRVLDEMCRISISRFMRDRRVYQALQSTLLPALASQVIGRGARCITAWSAGCASGEEPYSLAILWRLGRLSELLEVELSLTASEADRALLARARRGSYPIGCLKELPRGWREEAFEAQPDGELKLRAVFRQMVSLLEPQDLRDTMPDGPFDLVLCRNLAFSYFDDQRQRSVAAALAARLSPGGLLVIGGHERLPDFVSSDGPRFVRQATLPVFRLA